LLALGAAGAAKRTTSESAPTTTATTMIPLATMWVMVMGS
jgi:hypothetical protein